MSRWCCFALTAGLALVTGSVAGASEGEDLAACLAKSDDSGGDATCLSVTYDACVASGVAETTLGMVACLDREAAAWDITLNDLWPKVRAQAAAIDSDPTSQTKDALADLLAAQRAWIAYRDAECRYAAQRYAGGTIQSVIAAGCLRDMTAERVIAFRDWLRPDG